MKANQKFVNDDEGVSPVIAVILMVAITVVLAATVYLWVSGFGNQQNNIVQASMAAKAVDLPTVTGAPTESTAETDSSDDAIEITYTAGQADMSLNDIKIVLDGIVLNDDAAIANIGFTEDATPAQCTSRPGADTTWSRGESVFLWKDTGADGDCGDAATLAGTHLLKVIVQNQVVLDTTLEVHDSLAS